MKCQSLFSGGKIEKKYFKMPSEIFIQTVKRYREQLVSFNSPTLRSKVFMISPYLRREPNTFRSRVISFGSLYVYIHQTFPFVIINRIQPNYSTCPYKRTVKQFSIL